MTSHAPAPHRHGLVPLPAIVRAMRPHQWAKNLLVFVPMLLAQHADTERLGRAGMAFLSFCACASAVYVINDLADLQADRTHPRKRHRPVASGALGRPAAVVLILVLLAAAFALAGSVDRACLTILASYVAINLAYSGFLRSQPLVDVIVLSAMYGLRLAMGAAATHTPLSPWLLAFALFFFTSLAFAKRYVELRHVEDTEPGEASCRGYARGDSALVATLGVASGYVSVLVLALYMNSDQMHALYGEGGPLWGLCPLMLYWISRVWLLARRGELHDDPVQFALTDRVSLLVGAIAVFITWLAAWQGPRLTACPISF
jgi:4-hydroxybenzoate polyprenyltransferase